MGFALKLAEARKMFNLREKLHRIIENVNRNMENATYVARIVYRFSEDLRLLFLPTTLKINFSCKFTSLNSLKTWHEKCIHGKS